MVVPNVEALILTAHEDAELSSLFVKDARVITRIRKIGDQEDGKK